MIHVVFAPSCVKFDKLIHPDVHFVFPIIKSSKGKKEICDDYITEWRSFVTNNPYFNLSHWLNEIEAEETPRQLFMQRKR